MDPASLWGSWGAPPSPNVVPPGSGSPDHPGGGMKEHVSLQRPRGRGEEHVFPSAHVVRHTCAPLRPRTKALGTRVPCCAPSGLCPGPAPLGPLLRGTTGPGLWVEGADSPAWSEMLRLSAPFSDPDRSHPRLSFWGPPFYRPLHCLTSVFEIDCGYIFKTTSPKCLFITAVFSAIKVFQGCGGGDLLALLFNNKRGVLS